MRKTYFHDKKVLITGGSSGLGEALSLEFSRLGAQVTVIARNAEKLTALCQEAQKRAFVIEAHVCDVVDRVGLAKLFKDRYFDIIILNAGVKENGSAVPLAVEKIIKTFEVNVFGSLYPLECIVPQMIKMGHGHLVFISSLGSYHGMLGANGYNASKAALSNLVDSLRMDLAARNLPIMVTQVKPGLIRTKMAASSGALSRFLSVSSQKAAARIIKGLCKKQQTIIFPKSFYFLTLVTSMLPTTMQMKLFSRLRGVSNAA